MELQNDERRRAGRLACKIPVRVRASGRTLHAHTEDLSRVGARLLIPLSELGLPANSSLTRVAHETTAILGDLASLEFHYEILGTLVRRMARPVRIGRGASGQTHVEVGCALRRSLTDAEVEFLGLPLPPLLSDLPDLEYEGRDEGDGEMRPALHSPLAVVVCATDNAEATPFAATAELSDRHGAIAYLSHVSDLPLLPDRPGVSGLLTAITQAYGNDPWVVLMREGQPVWSGAARIESVELGPKTGRVELQLAFSRALTAPERSRLRI
jgi:hypothetical protein